MIFVLSLVGTALSTIIRKFMSRRLSVFGKFNFTQAIEEFDNNGIRAMARGIYFPWKNPWGIYIISLEQKMLDNTQGRYN